MENPNYKIDEIFRQRLHDAEVPPPPFVWPAVEHELHKRRRHWIVWLFTFGIVIAGTLLWRLNVWDKPHSLSGAPFTDNQIKEQAIANLLKEAETTANLTANTTVEPPVSTTRDPFSAETPQTGLSEKWPATKRTSSEIRTSSTDLTVGMVKDQKETSKNAGFKTPNLQELNSVQTGLKPDLTGFEPSRQLELPIGTQTLQITQPGIVTSIIQPRHEASPKTFKSVVLRKKAGPKFCYDFAKHPSAWLLDVYAGPSLAQRSLTSRLDDEPYLDQRLATERRSVAMNAGLRASLMFNRNFLIRTGLHYDQVTEVFEFIDPTSVTYVLRYNNGDPTPDTLGVQYGENYLKTYNRYAMLDIPLIVGVEMRRGRSGFSINAGISANVLFQKRGVIVDPTTHEPARFGPIPEEPKNIGPNATLSQEVFRPNVGLSATASIQWYWHLNPHFRLFAEPSFRQVLRPVTLGNHPVEQRYSILGLRVGATKIF